MSWRSRIHRREQGISTEFQYAGSPNHEIPEKGFSCFAHCLRSRHTNEKLKEEHRRISLELRIHALGVLSVGRLCKSNRRISHTSEGTHRATCHTLSQSYRHLTEQPKGRVSATAGFFPVLMASSTFLRSCVVTLVGSLLSSMRP